MSAVPGPDQTAWDTAWNILRFGERIFSKNCWNFFQKVLVKNRDELRSKELMEAFANSERSFEEVMRFLSGNEVDDE